LTAKLHQQHKGKSKYDHSKYDSSEFFFDHGTLTVLKVKIAARNGGNETEKEAAFDQGTKRERTKCAQKSLLTNFDGCSRPCP
jgi:hypothetical protein